MRKESTLPLVNASDLYKTRITVNQVYLNYLAKGWTMVIASLYRRVCPLDNDHPRMFQLHKLSKTIGVPISPHRTSILFATDVQPQ